MVYDMHMRRRSGEITEQTRERPLLATLTDEKYLLKAFALAKLSKYMSTVVNYYASV